MGLLRSATAFEAYCKVYTADVTPDRILEFLLLDEEFPHSVRFSIDTLQNALEAIHGEGGKSRAEPLRRLVGRLQASLSYSSVEEILQRRHSGVPARHSVPVPRNPRDDLSALYRLQHSGRAGGIEQTVPVREFKLQ